MKNFGTQLSLGLWASLAVGMGIMSRSWETFFSLMTICAFFTAGFAASAALKSQRQAIRWTGIAGTLAFYGVILGFLLAGMERIYLVNGKGYPAWLASADLGPTTDIAGMLYVGAGAKGQARTLIDTAPGCVNKGAELFEKDGGMVVIRCGGSLWYDSHTYIAHVEDKR